MTKEDYKIVETSTKTIRSSNTKGHYKIVQDLHISDFITCYIINHHQVGLLDPYCEPIRW